MEIYISAVKLTEEQRFEIESYLSRKFHDKPWKAGITQKGMVFIQKSLQEGSEIVDIGTVKEILEGKN